VSEQATGVSETTLGYDIFTPLWGLVAVGAARTAGPTPPFDNAVADFVAGRRPELDDLVAKAVALGGFSAETAGIAERQGGWSNRGEASGQQLVLDLLLYSGFVESYPPDLDDPSVLGRLVDTAADLQLVNLMNALVGVAMARAPERDDAATVVLDIVKAAGRLVGADPDRAAGDTFRSWRIMCLPPVLRPDSPSPQSARDALRRYARELERLLS